MCEYAMRYEKCLGFATLPGRDSRIAEERSVARHPAHWETIAQYLLREARSHFRVFSGCE